MFTVAVISFPPLAFGTIIAFGFYFDFITRVLLVFLTALSAVTGLGLIAANFLFDFKSLEYLSPYWRAETYRNNAVKFWSIQIGLIIILILFWWEI